MTTPFALTKRDLAVLQFLTDRRGAPIEHVASEYFARDPFTGRANRNPMRACEQRLRALKRAGYLYFAREHDGRVRRQMVMPSNGVNGVTCPRASSRRVPARNAAHHVRTQDAVAQLASELRQRGWRVVSVKLEGDLRADDQRGRRTRRGDSYAAFPDAVMKVEAAGRGERTIAVEYVTSKYTNADILRKHDAFDRFDSSVWVADSKRTAERVHALTGEACRII